MILFVYQISFSFSNLIIEFDFYQIDTIGRTNITKRTNLLKWVNRCKNINEKLPLGMNSQAPTQPGLADILKKVYEQQLLSLVHFIIYIQNRVA